MTADVGDCIDAVDTRYGGYHSVTQDRAPHDHVAFVEWWGATAEITWKMNVDANCVVSFRAGPLLVT